MSYLDSIENVTYTKHLVPDPESDKNYPNQNMREVKSGHFVYVKCTPLKNPQVVAVSNDMMKTLGFAQNMASSHDFRSFFSGCNDKKSWSTPYALSIYGQEMYSNCPFGNGNGYGDGRATSLTEVVVDQKRWELQLKGCGKTPFSRNGDGRAVLRSSIREFIVSEAMYHLGIPTTRALSVISSTSDSVARPWFSSGYQRDVVKKHDVMESTPSIVLCRVAPSFLRVGHVELYNRRFKKNRDSNALKELTMLVKHIIFREYSDISKNMPFEDQVISMLKSASHKFAALVCEWMRVGYVQGNFNSDNCHVVGLTLDYGPFGFMDKFDPQWNPWIDGGKHFAYINQPEACRQNFCTFVDAVATLFHNNPSYKNKCQQIKYEHPGVTMNRINQMWAAKLGFEKFTFETNVLREKLFTLMERCEADYTSTWRQLAQIVSKNMSEDAVWDAIKYCFYKQPDQKDRQDWLVWINKWLDAHGNVSRNLVSTNMKKLSPKFIPKEWMLVSAYSSAGTGDSSVIYELQKLFETPYCEHDDLSSKYYRLTSADKSTKSCPYKSSGQSFTSCSS